MAGSHPQNHDPSSDVYSGKMVVRQLPPDLASRRGTPRGSTERGVVAVEGSSGERVKGDTDAGRTSVGGRG